MWICSVVKKYLRPYFNTYASVMVASLILTSGLVRYEATLHGNRTNSVCLFYTIVTLFQLHHGDDMMYEMRRRKPEPTLLPIQGIFNLPHHIGMV